MRKILSILFFLLFAASAQAATYWANGSASGQHCVNSATDPGAGSSSQTITQAMACAGTAYTDQGAGNSVMVAAGTYSEALTTFPNGTSWGSPFVLKCATRRTCIVQAPLQSGVMYMGGPNHFIEINGFIVDGEDSDTSTGMFFASATATGIHDLRIIDNEVRNANGQALQLGGMTDVLIYGNLIWGFGDSSVCSGGLCHGVYPSDNSHNVTIEGNVIHTGTGNGVTIYATDPATMSGNVVKGNLIYAVSDGVLAQADTLVYNNIIHDTAAEGIVSWHGSINVDSNTIYNVAGVGAVYIYAASGNTVRNNILWGTGGVITLDSAPDTVVGTNLCTSSCTITSDPLFTNAGANDFTLQIKSPAINAGATLGSPYNVDYAGVPRPQGAAYDLGAYEYQPSFPGATLALALGFEEPSGASATDSSGNSNTGTIAGGASRVAGRYGTGIALDGKSQYVTVADATSLDFSQGFTLSAWVSPAAASSTFTAIIRKNSDPNPSPYEFYATAEGWYGGCADGEIAGATQAASNVVACSATPLAINVWTHVALTYDGTNLILYKNGVAVTTAAASGFLPATAGTLQIGATEFGEYFSGVIDEVRAYNFALPVSSSYNSTFGAVCNAEEYAVATASIIGDANCPVNPSPRTSLVKAQAGGSFKIGSGTTFKVQGQ